MRKILKALCSNSSLPRCHVLGLLRMALHRVNCLQHIFEVKNDACILVPKLRGCWRRKLCSFALILLERGGSYDDRSAINPPQSVLRCPMLCERNGKEILQLILHVERNLLHHQYNQILHDSHLSYNGSWGFRIVSYLCFLCV